MMDSELLLCVEATGKTVYCFSDCDISSYPCTLSRDPTKGLCLINQNIAQTKNNTSIIREQGVCIVPVGLHSSRVCFQCCRYGHKSVKVRDDFPSIHFCSHDCLSNASSFLDTFGAAYVALTEAKGDFVHLCLLLLRLFHLRSSHQIDQFSRILQLEANKSSLNATLQNLSHMVYTVLQRYAPEALSSGDSPSSVYHCLQCLQYNSQPLPLPDLPRTTIYAIFPTLARINHSCQPNAVFTYVIQSGSIYLSLIPTRSIAQGEEITVSYLSDLCIPLSLRRKLLLDAFKFTCECSRCVLEQKQCALQESASFTNALLTQLHQQGHYTHDSYDVVIEHIENILSSDVYAACELSLGLLRSLQTQKNNTNIGIHVRCVAAINMCWKYTLGYIPPTVSLLMMVLSACVLVLGEKRQGISAATLSILLRTLEPCVSAVRILHSEETAPETLYPYAQLCEKICRSYKVLSSANL